MSERAALDTNILLYAFSNDPRALIASRLLKDRPVISVQTLNEFVNVARRKQLLHERELQEAIATIIGTANAVMPLTLTAHLRGYDISNRYRLHIYDALILAVALEASCPILYSEDMHDGLVIDDRLTIRNPFA